ncbi:hypothetical protein AVEN_164951-1, partial [Araneus ventricosus]
FEAIRELFWDASSKLELWLDDEEDNCADIPYPTFYSTTMDEPWKSFNVLQAHMQGIYLMASVLASAALRNRNRSSAT